MFQTKFVEEIKTYFTFSSPFFPKIISLRGNVDKFFSVRETTDENITWRMHLACWTTNTTDTHSECVILIAFHSNNFYTKAPPCYVNLYFVSC